MERIVRTFSAGIRLIILLAVLAACKEDEGIVRQQEVTPAFAWEENSFLLETDNGWGLTRFRDHIALSNFTLRCQYHLSWNGNMTTGDKTDAVLKIAEVGKKLQTIQLDQLSVKDIDGLYYSIQFREGEREGSLTFSK